MIHIEYTREESLGFDDNVKFVIDYDMRTRETASFQCLCGILASMSDDVIFNSEPVTETDVDVYGIIPRRSIRQFCKPENIDAFMTFEVPENDRMVLDGTNHTLRISLDDGRTRELECDCILAEKIPYIMFFERYAKRILK